MTCLIRTVTAALTQHQIPPELLTLGVKASIEDFGTGYSSLFYLKRLPASELKIDRAFVNELQQHSEDATIVSAIVALAQSLQMKVAAKGVETAEQQAFLTSLGCNTLQGYLLGRPIPPDRVNELADFVGDEKVDPAAARLPDEPPLVAQVTPA